MKYTEKMKTDGELAVRRLSEEAAKYYNGTDPLTVFAYENENGEMRYSYSYSTNPYADRYKTENLTFEELQEAFEEAQKELDRQLEADGEPDYSEIDMEQYEQKIKNTMEQLTEKEEELLSSFLPTAIVADAFNTSTEVRAVKEKYDLNWREIRGIAFRLQGKMRTEPEKQPEPTNISTPQAADPMKYNGGTKLAGEAACRRLSKKAAEYYNAHQLSVFEYNNENGEKRYAYSSDSDENARAEDLTFEELQAALEDMQSQAEVMLAQDKDLSEPEQTPKPDEFLTGDYVRTPRGNFSLTSLSREQMQAAGYGLHHESEDGKYYIMGNGTDAFAVAKQPERQPVKTEKNYEFEYQLLDRLRFDCKYFLSGGNRAAKNLWAGNVKDQIAKMRELYHMLPEKPEWLTEQDIDRYEKLMTTATVPEMQSDEKELIALLTVKQCGFTKYFNMGDASMDDIFRQLKKAANPFIEIKGEVISDEGRFAEFEQSGKVSVSVTADIDNDSITVYEINGVLEEKRTDENTRIWHRSKMANFLKDRVREPKTDNSLHSPYHGVGRSHVSEHEREM